MKKLIYTSFILSVFQFIANAQLKGADMETKFDLFRNIYQSLNSRSKTKNFLFRKISTYREDVDALHHINASILF